MNLVPIGTMVTPFSASTVSRASMASFSVISPWTLSVMGVVNARLGARKIVLPRYSA